MMTKSMTTNSITDQFDGTGTTGCANVAPIWDVPARLVLVANRG